jgi:hypothetical protein
MLATAMRSSAMVMLRGILLALNSTLRIASEMIYKNNKKVVLLLAIEKRDQIASDFLIASDT